MPKLMKRAILIGAVCAALTLGVTGAEAVPLYSYTIHSPGPSQVIDSATAVSQNATATSDFGALGTLNRTASAAAGWGYVSGSSYASLNLPVEANFFPHDFSQERSSFRLDNILLIAPAGIDPGTPVQYSINFDVTGSMAAGATGGYGAGASARLSTGNGDIGYIQVDPTGLVVASGLFGGFPFDGSLGAASGVTPLLTGGAGEMIEIFLGLETSAVVARNFDASPGFAHAFADFSHTALFGPTVFNFFDLTGAPLDGWTASSTDGCIVNNRYLCAPVAPSPVPAPSTVWLLCSAVISLGAARRRPA